MEKNTGVLRLLIYKIPIQQCVLSITIQAEQMTEEQIAGMYE